MLVILSITLIGGFRCPVDPMDEEPYDLFYFPLMVKVILRPRLIMSPHTHSHGEPLGKLEDILVCFIITNKKQAGLAGDGA